MNLPEIDINHVSMTYPAADKKITALQDVSLQIQKGEFVSLLGPSGCGKTTLLRMIADLLAPTSGEIMVEGKTPREIRLQRKYGIVFQNSVLYDWRRVKSNVALPLELEHMPKRQIKERVDELLELVGLTKFKNHYPWQLSGGMQQRVALARALANNPEILLMDEPFSALDEFTRERLNDELLRIWRQIGTTVVFVTHSIAEAVFLSDRVCVLSANPGRLTAIDEIPLPRPRYQQMRNTPEFFELVAHIREQFEEESK